MQTFNNPIKTKDVQVIQLKQNHAECMVNSWSIYDAYYSSEAQKSANDDGMKDIEMDIQFGGSGKGGVSTSTSLAAASSELLSGTLGTSRSVFGNDENMSETVFSSVFGATSEAGAVAEGAPQVATVQLEKDFSQLNQQSLLNSLHIVEKAVMSNLYEKKLVAYRDIQDVEILESKRIEKLLEQQEFAEQNGEDGEDEEDSGKANDTLDQDLEDGIETNSVPSIQLLWSYRCELTRDRKVSYASWNKINEDILAVAYTKRNHAENSDDGMILCWSIKNPDVILFFNFLI